MMCSFLFFPCTRCFFSFRERFPTSRCHTYGVIPVCKKDPSASLGMTIWGKRPSKHVRCTKRRISIPLLLGYAPVPSFRAQSRNPPCTLFFLAPFASGSPFSAISHTALYPIPSFRAQREIFLALRHFLLPSQVVSRFPLSHIGRYTGMQERSRATLGMTVRE